MASSDVTKSVIINTMVMASKLILIKITTFIVSNALPKRIRKT